MKTEECFCNYATFLILHVSGLDHFLQMMITFPFFALFHVVARYREREREQCDIDLESDGWTEKMRKQGGKNGIETERKRK